MKSPVKAILASALLAGGIQACAPPADSSEHADALTLHLASWNIANLYHREGRSIPGRRLTRNRDDYQRLAEYARRLEADVVALQEVNSVAAVQRIFPADEWRVFMSARRQADFRACGAAPRCDTDGIYTAFAVRRGIEVRVMAPGDALGVTRDAAAPDSRSLRWGTDIEIRHGETRLRLLSVHLKSGCARGRLDPPRGGARLRDPDCEALARQRNPLDAWIDAREHAGEAFAVIGDFNRAFDVHGEGDHFWQRIDDGEPSGAQLYRLPYKRESPCWKDAPPARHYRQPIDFLVFGQKAWQWVRRDSFGWLNYAPEHAPRWRRLSDHCAIRVQLDLPG